MPHQIPQPLFGINFGSFPIYAVMLFIAFIAGVILFKKTFKKKFFSKCVNKRIKRSFFWSGIFAVIGSNVITNMMFDDSMHLPVIQRFTQGRFSFYFALLTFLVSAAILLRINKINLKFALNKIVSPILIVQFFSRIGCSLAGCCFGKSFELFGASIPLPVRETEALFALVLLIAFHKRSFDKHLKIYLFSYSLFRFISDFFRGDDRGSLFGIEILSPTQIVAFFVIFISGMWLFARPFFRLIGQEKALDDLKENVREFFEGFRKNVLRRKEPYAPVPFNYVEPKGTKHPLKVIIALLLVFSIIFLSFVYINPMDFEWFEDIRDSISYTFFKKRTPQNNIGTLNGADVLRLYGKTPIASDDEALEFAKSYDKWKDFRFSEAKTKKLSNGNNLYVFRQEHDGKPIIGRNRLLITDKDNKPLYVAGDEASLTITNEIKPSFTSTAPTVKEAFGDGILFIEKTECWYDTGSGLVDAYHAVLSKDGKTSVAGAVLQKSDEKLICLTDPDTSCPIDSSVTDITVAGKNVCTMLENNDTDAIKQTSKTDISDAPKTEIGLATIEKAICEAFGKLDVTAEQYRTIIESAAEVASLIPSLSINLYSEILGEETRSALINSGAPVSVADEATEVIAKAFKKCGVKAEDDECVSSITADTRKSTYKHSINFASDVDAFNLTTQANHITAITLTTESPVMFEIYDGGGRAVVSMYVEEEETITLYPEDGTDFDFRISDYSGKSVLGSAADYKLILESEEETIPEGIESTLSRITDAYDSSLAPVFLSMCLENGKPIPIEENLGMSLIAPVLDSIAQDCSGMGDSIDTSKSMIASCLIKDGGTNEKLYTLKGTEMELSYVDHIETEDFIALKAKIVISMGGMDIYNGYTFMRLQDYDYDLSSLPQEQRTTVELISTIFGGDYYITDMNHSYLYEMFGDTPGSISPTSDVESLYDLWYDEVKIVGGMYPVTLKHIDTEKALKAGHSPEKLEGFEQYTVRYNLTQLKSVRVSVNITYEILSGISTHGKPLKTFADLISDPFGYGIDWALSQNETTNVVWTCIGYVTDFKGAVTDAITDEVLGVVFDACGQAAKQFSNVLDEFDELIGQYETQLLQLTA